MIVLERPSWFARFYSLKTDQSKPVVPIPAGIRILGGVDVLPVTHTLVAQADTLFRVTGWAATVDPADRVQDVAISLDRVTQGSVTHFDREAVAAAYRRDDFLHSGWEIVLDLHHIAIGTHEFEADVITSKGRAAHFTATLEVIE